MNQSGHKLLKKVGVLACLWVGFAAYAAGQAVNPALEYQVKAAFLLNFTKFIDWPPAAFATPESPIAICIVGSDPFGRILDEIVQGEAVNARKVVVQRIGGQVPGAAELARWCS